MSSRPRIPAWVWGIILALASIEPLTHVWLACFPPPGTASTGLHTVDSVNYLHHMRMFETGFRSPFATCRAPHGEQYAGYFATPFWFFGLIGLVGRLLRLDDFLMLGLANGAGAALYLLAAYVFIREVMPKRANLAFSLFAVGGGLGGLLYLVTGLLSLHDAPAFESYFMRFAYYELCERTYLAPHLLLPRLHYTLPLAIGIYGLTRFIRGVRKGRFPGTFSMGLIFVGGLLNARTGAMLGGVAALYVLCLPGGSWRRRFELATRYAVPAGLGVGAALALLRANPTFAVNALELGRLSLWVSPFLSVVFFHFFTVPRQVGLNLRRFPRPPAVLAWSVVGYLGVFAVLFLAYQGYHGNLLIARDHAAPVAVSDWALLGLLPGFLFAWRRKRSAGARDEINDVDAWLTLWLLLFLALSFSAFGRGWFLRWGPNRLSVLLMLPISMLSAQSLARMPAHRARAIAGAMLTCGTCSILVAAACFQGPLGHVPGRGPFAWAHSEVMSETDARLLDALGPGVVLTPYKDYPFFGDVISLRPGNRALIGDGALSLSDQPVSAMRRGVSRFFSADEDNVYREQFVRDWCVEYIYCPDTAPVAPEVTDQLHGSPRFHEVAAEGRGAVFSVTAPR